ncbi:MAG: metal-dependent protease of the PAD1/JAB1 superfamily, partial [Phormidesmis sp.]
HVAVPSECDRAQAWPTYAYVIVSVCNGKAVDIQNWALDLSRQIQPEAMRVSSSTSSGAKDRMPVSA